MNKHFKRDPESVDFFQGAQSHHEPGQRRYGRNAVPSSTVTRSAPINFTVPAELLRNDKLEARPFLAAKRGQNVQNQFGGTIADRFDSKIYGRTARFFFGRSPAAQHH
jgi:hypothetical protein